MDAKRKGLKGRLRLNAVRKRPSSKKGQTVSTHLQFALFSSLMSKCFTYVSIGCDTKKGQIFLKFCFARRVSVSNHFQGLTNI